MLPLSVLNSDSEMVLSDRAENGEISAKKRRYLVINEETYIEFPEAESGTNKKHLIPITEINKKLEAVLKDTGSANHEVQELSITSKHDDVNSLSIDKNFPNQHENPLETNSRDVASVDTSDDDIPDDMVIVTDDEQEEETIGEINNEMVIVTEDEQEEETIGQINNEMSTITHESKRNIFNLVKLFESSESTKNSNKIIFKRCKGDGNQPKYEIVKQVSQIGSYTRSRNGTIDATDYFPIKFNKKISLPLINAETNSETTDISMAKSLECPYCNFKISNGKIMRHLIIQHIEACLCLKCDTVVRCSKLRIHSRTHSSCNLKCFKCSFESNREKSFTTHLLSYHKDSLFRQCCLCGEWMKKSGNHQVHFVSLMEHVKSKHLLD